MAEKRKLLISSVGFKIEEFYYPPFELYEKEFLCVGIGWTHRELIFKILSGETKIEGITIYEGFARVYDIKPKNLLQKIFRKDTIGNILKNYSLAQKEKIYHILEENPLVKIENLSLYKIRLLSLLLGIENNLYCSYYGGGIGAYLGEIYPIIQNSIAVQGSMIEVLNADITDIPTWAKKCYTQLKK
ncbi:MAG: hypothetical protein MUC49_00820 [Raineya sp.]|jgi:hypothetical protein|nr:hypothetical protein [Raineya sp.]